MENFATLEAWLSQAGYLEGQQAGFEPDSWRDFQLPAGTYAYWQQQCAEHQYCSKDRRLWRQF